MSNETDKGREWPKYKCHKVVEALKITTSVESDNGRTELRVEDFPPIYMDTETSARFKFKDDEGNHDMGYYVVYPDGYVSWSPTKAFNEGYTRL